MDLQALSKQGKVSLLTLPRTEFKSTQNDNTNAASAGVPVAASNCNDDTAPLLLLQLPKGWTTQDLKDSKFIGSSADSSQVVLVVESKKTSFSINRLETSNCLIMVPPPQYDNDNDNDMEQGASKKSKLTATGKTILPVPARLLTPGGSGSSFLELREKPLWIHDLKMSLQEHVLNPYNVHINPYNNDNSNDHSNNIKNSSTALCAGRTVYDLAVYLQSSQAQVQSALDAIQAFALPRTHPVAYCLLSEETLLVACNAIVSALSEADDCQDYAVTGVSVKRLVEHVVQNMSAEESYVDADFVIRHCLSTLSVSVVEHVDGDDNIRLSVGKVAVCVARRLLQKQMAPWEETLFLSRWQSELPGVGRAYQVSCDMLRGLAVDSVADGGADGGDGGGADERFFKYLPCEKLPVDSAMRIQRLFQEKQMWQLPELEPYLVGLADSLSQAEILLCYTTIGTAEDGSKVYSKK